MNKKGLGGPLIIFLVMMFLLAAAFGVAILNGVTNNLMDEVTPVFNDLGTVSNTGTTGDNMSENANYVITPLNTIVNSFNWLLGVAYAIALILIMVLAASFRMTGEKYLIVFFLLLAILGLIFSIGISNAYEDIHGANDDIGTSLQEQTLLSWLIIHSPLITMLILFIAGIIMFTGQPEAFA